jgi:hypothetical protein
MDEQYPVKSAGASLRAAGIRPCAGLSVTPSAVAVAVDAGTGLVPVLSVKVGAGVEVGEVKLGIGVRGGAESELEMTGGTGWLSHQPGDGITLAYVSMAAMLASVPMAAVIAVMYVAALDFFPWLACLGGAALAPVLMLSFSPI